MPSLNRVSTRMLVLLLSALLGGGPELAQAAQQPSPTPQQQSQTADVPPESNSRSTTIPSTLPAASGSDIDPARGPLEPVAPSEPNQNPAPTAQTQPGGTPQAPPVASPNAPATPQPSEPLGTAAAERTPTTGGAASKPAGSAIAPAKQRQVRSLLIKLGAVAGAAVAIGTVAALSKGTASKPPGAR